MRKKVNINLKIIKDYMEENNLSVEAFCELCKISRSEYKRIMNYDGSLGGRPIYNVAVALGVKCDDLLNIKRDKK